jgi:penicillin-binding protein 1A
MDRSMVASPDSTQTAITESPTFLVIDGMPPRRPIWRRLLKWTLFLVIGAANAAVIVVVAGYAYFSTGLPSIPSVADYRPQSLSETISADGQISGEFFDRRRKVVPYQRIPKKLVQAFIASEDQHFFEHGGIDLIGTSRAALQTFVFRHKVQGGSTLSQQTAKDVLVEAEAKKINDGEIRAEVDKRLKVKGIKKEEGSGPDSEYQKAWMAEYIRISEQKLREAHATGTRKTLGRKIRELILARRLEKALTKEEILYLYLNQVYLGHHSYGVQAAAENYFRKNVEDLTLPEAALIAGLPQAPSKYSPFAHPESAKARRRYVLRRMFEEGMITDKERKDAEEAEIKVFPMDDIFRETSPFYTEHVRREVVRKYGNKRVLNEGLRIETAMDLEKQRAAQHAMLRGLMEVDHRQGYGGPVMHLEKNDLPAMKKRLAAAWPKGTFKPGDYMVGIVEKVEDARAEVSIGEEKGILPLAGMRWAHRVNSEAYYPSSLINKITGVLKPGDVVLVKKVEKKDYDKDDSATKSVPEAPLLFSLEQEPELQGAIVSVDPWTGYVAAMIGGYDFEASEFNRAFQACRQPGSAFKPIVYSAAVEKLDYTPATTITDAPIVYHSEEDQMSWKPQNFGEDFKGEVTVRTAVINSMNIPAVKTAAAVGIGEIVAWAKKLGLNTPVKLELGSALGSSCTTLWELTGVYALLDRYGLKGKSTFVRRVLDRSGRVLEDHSDYRDPFVPLTSRMADAFAKVVEPSERVMDEKTAFITVHLMHEVATVGTGASASKLGKPVAGKTGTTNDSYDTWFMAFTHDLVTGVWLGYDHNQHPLGRYETGGRASLPIWLSYMQKALRGRPQEMFPEPEGIVWVNIDPENGKRAGADTKRSVREPFKEGTEPKGDEKDKPKVQNSDVFNQ